MQSLPTDSIRRISSLVDHQTRRRLMEIRPFAEANRDQTTRNRASLANAERRVAQQPHLRQLAEFFQQNAVKSLLAPRFVRRAAHWDDNGKVARRTNSIYESIRKVVPPHIPVFVERKYSSAYSDVEDDEPSNTGSSSDNNFIGKKRYPTPEYIKVITVKFGPYTVRFVFDWGLGVRWTTELYVFRSFTHERQEWVFGLDYTQGYDDDNGKFAANHLYQVPRHVQHTVPPAALDAVTECVALALVVHGAFGLLDHTLESRMYLLCKGNPITTCTPHDARVVEHVARILRLKSIQTELAAKESKVQHLEDWPRFKM